MATFLDTLTGLVPEELQALLDLAEPGPVGSESKTFSEDLALTRPLDLLGVTAQLSAKVGGTLRLWATGENVPLLEALGDGTVESPGFGEVLAVADGQAILEVGLAGSLSLGASTEDFPARGLRVSGSAKAGSEVRWRHLRAVPIGNDLRDELRALLKSSLLPQHVLRRGRIAELRQPEVFVLDARMFVHLGVDTAYGARFTLEEVLRLGDGLFRGLDDAVRLHVAATISASLGWSLYERMQLAVGRFHLLHPERVRVRLVRSRRGELTLGAKAALQVTYDFGKNLAESVLERAFDLVSGRQVLEALGELSRRMDRLTGQLSAEGLITAEGTWTTAAFARLRAALAGELAEDLGVLLGRAGLSEIRDEELGALARFGHELGRSLAGLETKVEDLLGEALGKKALGPGSRLRRGLQRLTELDPADPLAVLGGPQAGGQEAELIEALVGESLEDVLFGRRPGTASPALARAVALARKALGLIERLESFSAGNLLAGADRFAERAGVGPVLGWLRQNATSREALQAALGTRAGKLAERLLGKGLTAVSDEDFERLRGVLARITPETLADLEKRLRTHLQRLSGEAGFSLGVEIGRISERAAILDFEAEPGSPGWSDLGRWLAHGDLESLLSRLEPGTALDDDAPAASDAAGEDEPEPFLLREALLYTSQTKVAAFSLFFSLFGGKRSRERVSVVERTQQVRRLDAGPTPFRRQATYTGGVLRKYSNEPHFSGRHIAEVGLWLAGDLASERSRQPSWSAPFTTVEGALRIKIARADSRTREAERHGLGNLLTALGFLETTEFVGTIPDEATTELALELWLPPEVVTAVFQPADADLGLDLRNAAIRHFQEPLVARGTKPSGAFLAAVVGDPRCERGLDSRQAFLEAFGPGQFTVVHPGTGVRESRPLARWVEQASGGRLAQILQPELDRLITIRRRLGQRHAAVAGAFARPPAAAWDEATRRFRPWVRLLNVGSAYNPAFAVAFVLARAQRLAPEALGQARGLAILRWRQDEEETWRRRIFELTSGIAVHAPGQGLRTLP